MSQNIPQPIKDQYLNTDLLLAEEYFVTFYKFGYCNI